ncbi:MAG: protein-glutamate O-methyltransferase CheR [Oscillospiraceae bacterium]|jgi:chemotaxis protein methyltransferase CheR|nr:protein-glutamate O-methyltransferase CheR [Oscillospiraceae bacterium]
MNIDDRDFLQLTKYMQEQFGINLEKKRTLIEGRLSNTLQQKGFTNFHDYIGDVLGDKSGQKIDELVTKLTTNYTYFMREAAHYQFMTATALPEWVSKIKNHDLRVWSAGCSSGEEAYTAAMVMSEYFGGHKNEWDTTILATDISTRVLNIGKGGMYSAQSLDQLDEKWKTKYFKKISPDQYKVSDALAREVVFGQFNLMGSFAQFKRKFHIIFCRNVMIYFDAPTKAALTKKFFDILEPDGYLFIGMSETLSGINDDFKQISPAIYKKVLA